MPKIVDHTERRTQIVDALLTVAARDGHEQVTSRAVARELGVATGSLWHYFPNFDAVLEAAAVEVTRQTLARIDDAASGLIGIARLRATMNEVLPLNDATRVEAHMVVGFWGRLASHSPSPDAPSPDSPSPHAPSSVSWRDRIADALHEAIAHDEMAADAPVGALASLLHSVSYGQQVMQVIENPSRDVHWGVVDACIGGWLR